MKILGGLTNNEVKFLVTLDIDEVKSKKKIDGFLEKTIKEQKIVFDVAIGKSEHNISEFLKKHKEKKANIVFDVAVGASNSRITEYFKNKQQQTQSIIFYVNENATRAKINNSLKKMVFNEALIELKANTALSTNNINKYIDNAKLHKKFIELDVAENGFALVNSKIDGKNLSKAKISLSLNQDAYGDISESVKQKVFGGATLVGKLDFKLTQKIISEQINRMKLPKVALDVSPVVTKETTKTTPSTSTVKNNTPSATSSDGIIIGSKSYAFETITNQYNKLNKVVELFNKTREESEEAFIRRLKTSGKQVEIIRDAQTNQITKIATTYKNSANEIQKDFFTPITRQYKESKEHSNDATKSIHGFVKEVEKLKNTETFNINTEIDKLNKKLIEAKHNGTITAKMFNDLSNSKPTSRNDIDKLTGDLEKHESVIRRRIKLDKEQLSLISQQEQLMANLTRIEKMYLKTVPKEQADALRARINGLKELKALSLKGDDFYSLNMGDVRDAKEQIAIVRNQVKGLNAEATEASKQSLGVLSSIKTAFEKFPIWMLASTAFFGTIATIREFGSIIIDVDKKMTDLKKVMSDDTDFGAIFDTATKSAETFGKTISETLDAYVMFAKQGFKGNELETLANAGLVAGNVGDIDAGKASEYLTASILQWDKDTNEAMGVVDSWNEISNNFATTVENLAQGQAKAGATARALGMDFDQLNAVVGTLNARTKQSGNEIGNFVKSTFSNILTNKAGTILDELDVDLENADGTMRDIMDVYKDVAKIYVTLDQADKNRVTLGLAGKYHVSRMQTLLDDLGKADSMYDQMYDSSQNSANSAMSENQKYMQSLEARMNLARVEVEKLALAIGEAFMTEGMVQALQAFRFFAETVSTITNKVGFLPVAFAGVLLILTTVSRRFAGLIGRLTQYIGSARKAKVATNQLTEAQKLNNKSDILQRTSIVGATKVIDSNSNQLAKNTDQTKKNADAKGKAAKASKFLSLGFGALGIASLAVGFGIEALLGWMGKARQAQEDYANKMQEQLTNFELNKTAIHELSEKYKELSELHSNGQLDPNTEKYAEYTEVQNKLAELLPDVKVGEDKLGNSILNSTSYIELKIDMLEKQLEAQKALNEEEAKAKKEEELDTARDSVKDSKKKIDKKLGNAGDRLIGLKTLEKNYKELKFFDEEGKEISLLKQLGIERWGEELKTAEQHLKAIQTLEGMLADKKRIKLSDGAENIIENSLAWLKEDFKDVEKAQSELVKSNEILRASYADSLKEIIDSSTSLSDEARKNFEDVAFSTLGLAKSEEDFEAISQAFETMASSTFVNKDLVEDAFSTISKVTEDMKNSGITDVDELAERYKSTFDNIKKYVLQMSGLNVKSDEYTALSEALDRVTSDVYEFEVEVLESAKAQGKSKDEARELLTAKGELEEGAEELTKSLDEEVEALKKTSKFYEKLSGVSDDQIDKTEELIFLYKHLSEKIERTAEEEENYTETLKLLNKLYPHLIENGEARIDNIELENNAVKTLHEAYQVAKEGIMNEEEKNTLVQAENVYARLKNLKEESKAIAEIQAQYAENNELSSNNFAKLVSMGAVKANQNSFYTPNQKAQTSKEVIENSSKVHTDKIDEAMKELRYSTDELSNSVKNAEKREEERQKALKDSEKALTLLEKVTKKYAGVLEKLNTELAKVQALQRKYPTHSKEYRDALEAESKLIQEQIDLNRQKVKEIGAGASSSPSVSSTGTKLSGNSTQSSIWNYFKSKGLSENAVAGIMGNIQQESNFSSTAVNKSSGATGIFQWLGSRLKELQAYANTKGTSHTDLQTQLEFAWKELQSTEKKSLTSLQKNMTASQHASEFERLFERSGASAVANRQNYANSAYNTFAGSNVGYTSTSIASGGSDSDEQLEIQKLIQEEQVLLEQLENFRFKVLTSSLDEYSYKAEMQKKEIENQEAIKNSYAKSSESWEKATKSQYENQKVARKALNDELWLTNHYLENSQITKAQRYELLDRQAQLNTELKNSGNELKNYFSQIVEGRLARFDNQRNTYQTELDWEDVKIKSVDPASERYVETLKRANSFREKLIENIKQEQKYIDQQIYSGELTVDMYETLVDRAKELKKEAIEAVLALQETNYAIIQASVNVSNKKIDDYDFNIDRSIAIKDLYEEGSADQLKELNYQLEQQKLKLKEIQSIGEKIQVNMKTLDLGHEKLAELEEQLEDNTLAWYATQEAIQGTEEAIKSLNEAISDQIKDLREDLADDIIDALKDAYGEAKDIKIKAIEDEIEAEEKRHKKVMKQYDDELDAFNKIIDAKRREIDDSDRDKKHDDNMSELQKELKELEDRKTSISAINTYDAKKEREELDKQISEVKKQIAEAEYEYSKELQLQALDDELERKTEHYEELQELEDKNYEKNIERLDDEKEYWSKYYEDIINDERRWHKTRETLTKGTNEQISAEMNKLKSEISKHIGDLKVSLPDLADTLNGTMNAVGMNIRDSVIFELENLLKKIDEVNSEVNKLENRRSEITNKYGSSVDTKANNSLSNENGKIKEADLKVILAKFMDEQIAGKLDSDKDSAQIGFIKKRASALAEEGRKEGSTISSSQSLNDIMSSLGSDQLKQVGSYFSTNSNESEFETQEYLRYIEDYGKNVFGQGKTLSTGDKQILLGKFINRNLVAKASSEASKKELEKLGTSLGLEGRKSATIASATASFDSQLKSLTSPQVLELSDFMIKNSTLISDGASRSHLMEFVERMKLAHTKDYQVPTGLDTGGMTKAWGSSGGYDGKGGKMALLHEREIVLNPIDTERMFKVSSIMESIMNTIGRAIKLPTLTKPNSIASPATTNETTHIHINIDKMNGSQSDINNLATQVQNKLLREKGKR